MNEYKKKYKSYDPITSWGIILIHFDKNFNYNHPDDKIKIDNYKEIKLENKQIIQITNDVMNNMKYLLVSRKHSLGYIEFIMGRYVISNIDHIIFLIQQMYSSEIDKIKNNLDNFTFLWNDLWNNKKNNPKYNSDFKKAELNFNKINNPKNTDIELLFLLENIKPTYSSPEYGFPKGRKNKNEDDLECAIREFCEETGYTQNDINIIKNIEPLIEDMTGTNGVKYRHVYYVAELVSNNKPVITDNNYEIGDINFFTFNDTKFIIRDYHIEKLNIITKILFYYLNLIVNFN